MTSIFLGAGSSRRDFFRAGNRRAATKGKKEIRKLMKKRARIAGINHMASSNRNGKSIRNQISEKHNFNESFSY
jgi:hypothetical protein